ncbi:histidine acid phosphatase-like protein [Pestalotiopsis sp. NC0098]|nr:histidine acid phosphatase-like protein [Pestalotiopsis sp. NC0098]
MAKQLALLALAAIPATTAETILGVYIFSRHGDRTPKALAPANLTSLGQEQVYQSGNYYRNKYVASDASSPIYKLSDDIAVASQMTITSQVDTVLQSSAQAFMQGVYPPVGTLSTQELANGSSVEGTLSGYQYIPINAVASASSSSNAENSGWLQGSSGCGNAVVSSNNYLSSSEYLSTLNSTNGFYQGLLPVINTTFNSSQASFKNGYTIYDYVHVATIHNSSIPSDDLLTNDTLNELFWLANAHEWGLAYNETDPIRAVAGATLAGQIVTQLNTTLTGKSKQPLAVQFGAYASFMSFFGLAQLQKLSDEWTGVVDYASSMVFELVADSDNVTAASYPASSDVSVRFLFSNGSAAANEPVAYPLFGQSETLLPWSTFVSEMNKFAIADTADWCTACGNSTGVCAEYASGSSGSGSDTSASSSSSGGNGISLPVAGVIGALVTLVVILGIEALVYLAAGLKVVKKSTLAAASAGGASGAVKA